MLVMPGLARLRQTFAGRYGLSPAKPVGGAATRLRVRSPFGEAKARRSIALFKMDARAVFCKDALRAFARA